MFITLIQFRLNVPLFLTAMVSLGIFSAAHASAVTTNKTMVQILSAENQRLIDNTLASLMLNDSADIRARAALAAGRIGDEKAVPSLVALLNGDKSEMVRVNAAFALGEIESPLAIAPLIVGLRTEAQRKAVQARMLEALGKIAPKAGTELPSVQNIIRQALAIEIAQGAASNEEMLLLGLTAAMNAKVTAAGPAIAQAVASPSARVRETATNALARLRVSDANDTLREIIASDPSAVVRANAARVLAATKDMDAYELLLKAAQSDENLNVRVAAVRGLATIKDARAVAPLAEMVSAATDRNLMLEMVGALGALLKGSNNLVRYQQLRELSPLLAERDFEIALAQISSKHYFAELESHKLNALLNGDWRRTSALATALAVCKDETSLKAKATRMLRAMLTIANTKLAYNYAVPTILESLAAFAPKDLKALLSPYLNASDPNIVATAAELLERPKPAGEPKRVLSAADFERALARAGQKPRAIMKTSKGDFVIELLPDVAPMTVDNFIALANNKFFDGQRIPRVVSNFVVQAGDPRGDMNGGPGYQIRCEINMVPFERGAVGMALSGKDTGGSQWFVTLTPTPHLDGGYTVFGKVVSGMDVVDQLTREDSLISVRIE